MINSIFLDTINGIKRERPPVWFMRQAGRVLPAYLELREKYTFKELLQIPDLAAEVTLQPIQYLGVDAAILFSDILVIPEALGMELEWTDKGPRFQEALREMEKPVEFLQPNPSHLEHVYKAIDAIIRSKPADVPLIGFCGAPFTVFCYMMQGLSSNHTFPEAIKYAYSQNKSFHAIMEKITLLSIEYAKNQAKHGISIFQLFESHADLIPVNFYLEHVMPYVKRIAAAVREAGTQMIFFPKGFGTGIQYLTKEDADFVSIDWHTCLYSAREMVKPEIGLQGNLDPRILFASQDVIKKELETYIPFAQKENRWIFNLGHGFMPGIPYENAKFVVDWIKSVDWKRK